MLKLKIWDLKVQIMGVNNDILSQPEFPFDHYIQRATKKGVETIGLCPFHDDHSPSFSGNAASGLWKCFADCGSGNWQQFLLKFGRAPLLRAVEKVNNEPKPSGWVIEASYYYQSVCDETF
jgi:CHC2-type zinc finger protein